METTYIAKFERQTTIQSNGQIFFPWMHPITEEQAKYFVAVGMGITVYKTEDGIQKAMPLSTTTPNKTQALLQKAFPSKAEKLDQVDEELVSLQAAYLEATWKETIAAAYKWNKEWLQGKIDEANEAKK